MKIHAFRISQRGTITLEEVLTHISSLPLDDRLRDISGCGIRLEDGRQGTSSWFLDFGALQHDGPGRASPLDPIRDFDLEEHEGFGQETAAYYHINQKAFILQYNHFGPRISKIQAYLSDFARLLNKQAGGLATEDDGFMLIPILKPEAADRLKQMSIVKSIEIALFVPGVLASKFDFAPSLRQILDGPLVASAESFKFQLSVSRKKGKSLSLEHVKQLAKDLLGVRDDVSTIQITAMESDDAPREPLDLLEARLIADPVIRKSGRRYARDDRWSALKHTFDIWLDNNQLG